MMNETRGIGNVSPVSYKKDCLVQVWLESRQLAMLLQWLEDNQRFVRFKSEIVSIALDELVSYLVNSGQIETIEFAEDARAKLEGRFGPSFNPKGKGRKNLVHNLTLDARRGEMIMQPKSHFGGVDRLEKLEKVDSVKNNASKVLNPDDIRTVAMTPAEMKRVYKETVKRMNIEEARRQLHEEKERIKAAGITEDGIIVNENQSNDVVDEMDYERFLERERKRDEDGEKEPNRSKTNDLS